jgi:glutathione S-transferase
MTLYDLTGSPFSARVRIQIRLKNLPVEIAEPPFSLRSAGGYMQTHYELIDLIRNEVSE